LGLNGCILIYVDDILVISTNFKEHLEHLQQVFERIKRINMKVKIQKCEFARGELVFLGFTVSGKGLKPEQHKVEVISKLEPPKNLTGLRSFIGMTSYYRRFIEGYSKLVAPLNKLLKKEVKYEWNNDCQESFEALKKKLSGAPILAHPDFNQTFKIITDASSIAIAAILAQIQNEEEVVIAYANRVLNKAEKNYSTTEKECLAVVWGIEHFRPYVYGKHFKVITDHAALKWLMKIKEPMGRLGRWVLKLQVFDFEIEHRKGTQHGNADGLS